MTTTRAVQVHTQSTGETRNHAVNFQGKLDSGELLTGTPTVVDANPPSPQVLTIDNKKVNTGTITINDVSCVAGEAVQYRVACTTAGTYNILITCGTTATPAQTVDCVVKLIVVAA